MTSKLFYTQTQNIVQTQRGKDWKYTFNMKIQKSKIKTIENVALRFKKQQFFKPL